MHASLLDMKSNYIELKLPQRGNFAAGLPRCAKHHDTWHCGSCSARLLEDKGRAPLGLGAPNEEMHYDVISFGPTGKVAVDHRAVWVA